MLEVQALLKELQEYSKESDKKDFDEKCIEAVKALLKSDNIYTILSKSEMEKNIAAPFFGKNNQNYPSVWLFSKLEYALLFAETYGFMLAGKHLVTKLDFKQTFDILYKFVFQGGYSVIIDDGQFNLTTFLYDVVNECFLITGRDKFIEKEQYEVLNLLNRMFFNGDKVWLAHIHDITGEQIITNNFTPLHRDSVVKIFADKRDAQEYAHNNGTDHEWGQDVSLKELEKILLMSCDNGNNMVEISVMDKTIRLNLDMLLAILEKINNSEVAILENSEKLGLEENKQFIEERKHNIETTENHAQEENKEMEQVGEKKEIGSTPEDIFLKLDKLQTSFDESIKYDKYKDELFDNLHKELTDYKNGVFEKVIDTMAMDLVRTIDTTKKSINLYQSKEYSEENYRRLLGLFEGIVEDLQDILYRQGIEPYSVPDDVVDVKRQKIISTQETSDPSLDNKVAERLADGYEKNGKVLRPERISIYKYNADKGGN